MKLITAGVFGIVLWLVAGADLFAQEVVFPAENLYARAPIIDGNAEAAATNAGVSAMLFARLFCRLDTVSDFNMRVRIDGQYAYVQIVVDESVCLRK